jgi:hypothetical protein
MKLTIFSLKPKPLQDILISLMTTANKHLNFMTLFRLPENELLPFVDFLLSPI